MVEDLGARVGIEVAGRLVGEHDGRPGPAPGDRNALLLSPGELGGTVRQAVGQPDLAGQLVHPRTVGLRPGELKRQDDVLLGRQHRQH